MPEPTVFNGRYELHRRLGKGGMAEVFLARDLQLDRPVAVKVLFPEYANDPNFVARFRREAQAAANLNHPNIVGVFDWGQEHGTYYIVMEYVEGQTLADLLRADGPLAPTVAVDIATDIAAALGGAHRAGVLHRDIKPGNIMVTPAGMVKVADWGIGRAMDASVEENLTQTGAVMGTATYFSPEQAQGLPLDPRSDLYALGVVLYEMTTGRTPFQGDSPVAIAYKHVQEAPRPPRSLNLDIPPELEAITLQLLEKRPDARYASADDLRADLRRYREGFKVHAMEHAAGATVVAGAAAAAGATQAVPAVESTRVHVPEPAPAYVERRSPYVEPPREKTGWAFLLALFVLLGVLIALLVLAAREFGITGGDEEPTVAQVEVPGVVDLQADEARRVLETAGFTVNEEPEQVVDATRVGIVLSQTPESGIRVDEGSAVTIKVGSQNTFAMPPLAGATPDSARATLQGLEFTGEVREEPEASDDVEAGLIIRTEPPAGEQVATTQTITFFVSSGPPTVVVPTCDGLTESDCVTRITGAGLNPQVVTEASDSVDEGRVIRVEGQGTEVENGATVRIVVSSGQGPVTVPPVEGLDRADAVAAIEDAGFEVNVVTQPVSPDSPDVDKVIGQSPDGNTQAEPGSTVTLTVGQADVGD